MANLVLGLQSHGSCYPCHICESRNDSRNGSGWISGKLRTLGSIRDNYHAWKETANSKLSLAKNFKNCVNLPMFDNSDDTLVLTLVPPAELHLLLGAVNHLYSHLRERWGSNEEGEYFADLWAKKGNVIREKLPYYAFNGNSCRTLLSGFCLELLRTSVPNEPCYHEYVDAFRKLDKVVTSCFGRNLDPNYEKYISEFRASFLFLGIPITPKLHIIFEHISQFMKLMKDLGWYPRGLGWYSEQAMESVHKDFMKIWQGSKYNISPLNPKYDQNLLRAVCHFNSLRVKPKC